ncbi:MAG: methylmalonyl Co-A mutase-associated GTPase MeaB [Actinobacteria bacterium]|nr:methylmalonyl Co-A mutase-associated GTPase MeaB [Actinomycetota bacterium]MSX83000.1 methylmalonyl Co-A mutase-associated GTPase MeaB [Actinomycetota bacterium]MSZ49129.1 methylmalonyl Co-A mutase-associated GTPase MeaB [Actinomycetota bacterium]MTA97445.1 methylmalonyl Co-A mutase-associated GTPase MeaB [Actinomycetota bacterium]
MTLDDYVAGIRRCDRTVIGKALTLVESTRLDHRELAQQLVAALLPFTGKAQRIGITGVPGAGKSTLIDTLGSHLTGAGHQVAVLAVDPSSTRSGGSILGDKTRMEKLSIDPQAFIRPSPTSGTLGGVTRATREAMAVVEAAGFDVVLVETVGVGQSETAVANMVDCFVVLMLARTGDQLQGIKKGVLELADVIAVNKADGENATEASRAARELSDAMHLIQPPDAIWQPLALTCSGLTGDGVEQLWAEVQRHHGVMEEAGEIQARRARQQVDWMWSMVNEQLLSRLQSSEAVRQIADRVQDDVRTAKTTASLAAAEILKAFDSQ